MPGLHTDPDPCDSDSAAKGQSAPMGELTDSIFRPFGKRPSDNKDRSPSTAPMENCPPLNPPEAGFCFNCGTELPHKPEGAISHPASADALSLFLRPFGLL